MCGINLIIDNTKSIDSSIICEMTNRTHHRGPDETSVKSFQKHHRNYHLGANRLKVTDQSDFANQPFYSSDQRFALLFNGEIYNYDSLKNELLSNGISFSSQSDTEVLFHWLRTKGAPGISKLEGMFAFIFIDFIEEKIISARDRFGIKPLYYFQNDRYFIFSSEIQSIVKTGLFPKKLNESQINHYLLYKYVKSPETFFQNVTELEPGKRLEIDKGNLCIESFLESNKIKETHAPSISEIENLIRDSLLQQMNAPVPVGLLLSGGVDSTLLLALAKNEGYTMPTYSLINSQDDRSFGTDDYKFARKAATLYGSEHHELEIDFSLLDNFDSFIQKTDQPIGDSSYLMTSEICRYASESMPSGQAGMKVLLSGAGADEIFGGYNRHLAFHYYLKYKNIITAFSPFFKTLVSVFPTGFSHPLRKHFRLFKKLGTTLDNSPVSTFHAFLTFNELPREKKVKHIQNFSSNSGWLSWALEHDQKNYLISDVLALSDKASMLHGIEMRVPYLDEKLVTYMNELPAESILKHGRKWILKELLKKYGGKEFANRPKEGFGLPLSSWLTNQKSTHLWTFVEERDHQIFRYLDKQLLKRLLLEQKQRKADHGPLLWSILVLAHWLDKNFG